MPASFDDRLTDAYDRGLSNGIDSLSKTDQELYRIQDFIIDYEMGGLSGFFYNRLPDIRRIEDAIAAMRKYKLTELSNLLSEAAALFVNYAESKTRPTWGSVLQKFDPNDKLDLIDSQIAELDNYGI
jgi:hypothetical protein